MRGGQPGVAGLVCIDRSDCGLTRRPPGSGPLAPVPGDVLAIPPCGRSRCGSADGASRIGDTAEASEAIADDGAGGSRLRRASFSTSLRRKPSTRRSFRRTGWPSALVSMATMIGVLPGAPRRRLPPERPPPREASSISTRPVRRLPASRSIITCMSSCSSFQAVFSVTPRRVRGLRSRPCSASGGYMARTKCAAAPGRGKSCTWLPSAGRALVEVAGLCFCLPQPGRQSRAASASETQPPATDPRFRKVHRSPSR